MSLVTAFVGWLAAQAKLWRRWVREANPPAGKRREANSTPEAKREWTPPPLSERATARNHAAMVDARLRREEAHAPRSLNAHRKQRRAGVIVARRVSLALDRLTATELIVLRHRARMRRFWQRWDVESPQWRRGPLSPVRLPRLPLGE